jgi:hypothetical protein
MQSALKKSGKYQAGFRETFCKGGVIAWFNII